MRHTKGALDRKYYIKNSSHSDVAFKLFLETFVMDTPPKKQKHRKRAVRKALWKHAKHRKPEGFRPRKSVGGSVSND